MSPQSSIAQYRITAKLGEGGMGAVYRASDTKLNREVAIKVIPDRFAQDPDRMARFTREAQVLASLNHPNIAAIYGVEERALVMELVEGPTLSGPIALEEALPIARQIADALEYAHEKGIIHRDLKPANIKVTGPASGYPGRVKVLDFGLAKALSSESSQAEARATVTMGATNTGVILGTAAYMSPEQAQGKDADRRADIWSFGVVLFEMLTGKTAFTGESISDTLASVLKIEPDWSALPPGTPAGIRRLLRQCLKKDRQRRLQAIGDARIALEEGQTEAEAEPKIPKRWRAPWAMVAAGLTLVSAALGVALWRTARPGPDTSRPLLQFSADLGPEAFKGFFTTAVLSPDGSRMVFPSRGPDGKQRLSTRLLNQPKPTPLAGTEGGSDPFFSPDSQWIGFFANAKMKKISVTGGAALTLCDTGSSRGASWCEDGSIIAALNSVGGLSRIPAAGGTPQPLTNPDEKGERSHRWPQILPGGQAVLFTVQKSFTSFEDFQIAVLSLRTGQWKVVQRGGYFGRYLPSGHLVYIHQGTLFGAPFDAARLEIRGTPAPLLEDVAANSAAGGGQFDFSLTGTLVYSSGKWESESRTIAWLDRAGKIQPLLATPGSYFDPHLSPDGKWLALAVNTGSSGDISVFDLARQSVARITFTGEGNRQPVWTPDGKHIVYASTVGVGALWWIRADGAGEPQKLIESKGGPMPNSFSSDGRWLAYRVSSPASSGYDIWTVPLDISDPERPKPGKPVLFLSSPAGAMAPAFSPDGRWMAYESGETGSYESYVRPFPGSGGKWQISSGGARYCLWSRSTSELVYVTFEGRILVVAYSVKGDSFAAEKPRPWPGPPVVATMNYNSPFDLSPDGKRLVVFPRPEAEENGSLHVTFLFNFFDEVRRKLPGN